MRRHILLFVLIVGVTAFAGSTSASGATHPKKVRKCHTRVVHRADGRNVRIRRCYWVTRRTKAKRPVTATTTSTTAPIADPSGLRAAVRDCANRERAKAGLPGLKADVTLDRAAEGHAEDMSARHYFSHDTPEGRTPWDRIEAALQGAAPFMTMGENIAMGYRDADAACEGWMNSPGHRANILDRDYTLIGTAWVDGYAVQDFGSR